jgi:hypothetical protein
LTIPSWKNLAVRLDKFIDYIGSGEEKDNLEGGTEVAI